MKQTLVSAALASAVSMSAAMADQVRPTAPDAETAKIITLVSSVPLAVDRAAYDLAEDAFAPTVTIDYTSLWGGEPTKTTPNDLMAAWRGIVPGFDATWHELGPVTVEISGATASATASVDGRHWIGNEIWRPIGQYHWDVEKLEGQWRVTRMVFEMTEEIGDRDLAAEAMKRAAISN